MHSIKDPQDSAKPYHFLPVFSLLLAATLWGVFWYPLRLLEQQGLQGLWATLFIYGGTFIVMAPMLWGRLNEFQRSPGLLIAIALASGCCNTAFILAILEGNVVRVLLLFYLSPLWATLIAWLFLKEQLHRSSILVLVLAMSGAMIMLWHPEIQFPWPRFGSDWLALISGFSFALVNSLVRHANQVSIQVKTSCSWLGVVVVAGVILTFSEQTLATASAMVVVAAMMLGAVGMVIMTFSVVYGVSYMPLHRSAIILLFEIVAGAISAQLLTDEVIHTREWLGGGLVVLAAYLSASRQVHASS